MENQIDIYSGVSTSTGSTEEIRRKIRIMEACLEGRPIQSRYRSNVGTLIWSNVHNCLFDWAAYDYRVDPASRPKVLRAWTREDMASMPWWTMFLRRKDDSTAWFTVNTLYPYGFISTATGSVTWDILLKSFEWSADGKNWAPCGTES